MFNTSAQTTDAGTIYLSFGNKSTVSSLNIGESMASTSVLGLGTLWQTGTTVDGDDDDDMGTDYWDDDEKSQTNNFNISVDFGTFIMDGLLLGARINYGRTNMKSERETNSYDYTSEDIYKTYSIGPILRYYISAGDASKVFLGASYCYGQIENEWENEYDYNTPGMMDEEYDGEIDPVKMSELEFSVGLSAAISDNISIEPSIYYGMIRMKTETTVSTAYTDMFGNISMIEDDVEQIDFFNSFGFKIAASFYF